MEKEEVVERGRALLAQLRAKYKTLSGIGKLTGIYRKRLSEIETGTGSRNQCELFIAAAEKVIGAEQNGMVIGNVVETLGGETSPLGVRYVLGPASYQEIEAREMQEFLPILRRAIERARAMLNIAAQFKNPESRTRLQHEAAKEVEELELAIRLFTAQFPNRLTELHDAQRKTWSSDDDVRRVSNSKRSKR